MSFRRKDKIILKFVFLLDGGMKILVLPCLSWISRMWHCLMAGTLEEDSTN